MTNLSASSMGNKFRSAVSVGSENQDLIGTALSVNMTIERFYRCPMDRSYINFNIRVHILKDVAVNNMYIQ